MRGLVWWLSLMGAHINEGTERRDRKETHRTRANPPPCNAPCRRVHEKNRTRINWLCGSGAPAHVFEGQCPRARLRPVTISLFEQRAGMHGPSFLHVDIQKEPP